ncbi:MAG TPA: hypothetical protein VGG38_10415 [Acidimicrobiales bacterium]
MAIAMSVLMPVALGFSVELGEDTVVNRSLQAVADAAALDAALYVNVSGASVTTEVQDAASENDPGATMTSSEGLWSGGTFTPYTASQCIPTTPPAHAACNAVKVTAASTVKHLFQSGHSALSRSAIAAVNPEAGFSIGTYLASFSSSQSGVLNVLLGSLGTSVNLTAVGYAGLANTNVTVQQLISASGGVLTPTNVLTTSLTAAQWVSFLNTAVETETALLSCGSSPIPYPCTASSNLTTLGGSVEARGPASLCQLVSINGSSCSSGTLSQSALAADINVLQTLTTEAELANGTNALNITSALNITGLTDVQLTASVIQVPQVAFGPVGTTATTGQVNINLTADLSLLGLIGVNLLDIPVTAADGTATLQSITCSNNAMTSTKILTLTTSVTSAITLAGLQISTLTVGGANTTLGYVGDDVPLSNATATLSPPNPQTVGTTSPSLSFGGLLGLGTLVSPLLNDTLGPVLGPVLQALGVSVGGAQVADLSTLCGSVTLVQ